MFTLHSWTFKVRPHRPFCWRSLVDLCCLREFHEFGGLDSMIEDHLSASQSPANTRKGLAPQVSAQHLGKEAGSRSRRKGAEPITTGTRPRRVPAHTKLAENTTSCKKVDLDNNHCRWTDQALVPSRMLVPKLSSSGVTRVMPNPAAP